MKRTFALLLSVLLALSLTACGKDKDNNKNTTGSAGSSGVANPGDGALDGAAGSGSAAGDSSMDKGLPNTGGSAAGSDALNPGDTGAGTNRTAGSAASSHDGTAAVPQSRVHGATYDQMLRNARVHDTDGRLWDHENAMTPGVSY